MEHEAYSVWLSLYNDDIKTVWLEERQELRKMSMLYCALDKELNKIKKDVVSDMDCVRAELKKRDYLLKCKSLNKLAQSQYFEPDPLANKENIAVPGITALSDLNKISHMGNLSPDSKHEKQCNIQDPNDLSATKISPKIDRSRFLKTRSAPSPSLIFCPVKNSSNNNKKIPAFNFDDSDDDLTIIDDVNVDSPKAINVSPTIVAETPDIMECSIIDKTMNLEPLRNSRKSKLSLKKKDSMLRKKRKKRIDSNVASMNIDEMLDYINQSDDEPGNVIPEEQSKNANGNIDLIGENKRNAPPCIVKNEVAPKSDKSPKFAYKEVVRGKKERQKLKGWSCRECEHFYKGLELTPAELQKKMNDCSRHRGKYNPREETFAGFWDLTFGPTPKTPEKQQTLDSFVFGNRKE